jgi:hypothetical protein
MPSKKFQMASKCNIAALLCFLLLKIPNQKKCKNGFFPKKIQTAEIFKRRKFYKTASHMGFGSFYRKTFDRIFFFTK